MKRTDFWKVSIKVYRQLMGILPVHCILIVLCSLVNGVFPAAVTVCLSQAIDNAQGYLEGKAGLDGVVLWGGLLCASYLAKQVFQLISSVSVNAGLFEKGTYHIRERLAEKTSGLSLLALEDADTHNMLHRASVCVEEESISLFFYHLLRMAAYVVSMASVTGVLLQYHIGFVLIIFVTVALPLVFKRRLSKRMYGLLAQQSWQDAQCSYLWELFFRPDAAKEMRMSGCAAYLEERYREKKARLVGERHALRRRGQTQTFWGNLSNGAGLCAALAFSLFLAAAQRISVGQFAACAAAVSALQAAAEAFFGLLGDLPKELSVIKDYYDYLELPQEEASGEGQIGEIASIELRDVSFRYPHREEDVLRHIDLTLEKGESLAVIGENGSGKTTLVKLLLGLYMPTEGTVYVNGRERAAFGRDALFGRESVLSQQFLKLKFSIRENVSLSDIERGNDDGRILQAIRDCGAEGIYEACGGLDRVLGKEFGSLDLSGGEWQKVAMARAVFKEYDLIVLDEPTSALDALRETEVLKKYLELLKGKAAVVISHRVGMCRLVDKVAVMKEGRIVACGKHEDLIRQDGEYRRLFLAQSAWYQ